MELELDQHLVDLIRMELHQYLDQLHQLLVVEEVLDMEPLLLFEMELLVVLVVVLDIWDQVVVDLVPHMVVLQELVILHHSPPHKVFLVEVEMAAVAVAVLLVLVVMEQVGQVEQVPQYQ